MIVKIYSYIIEKLYSYIIAKLYKSKRNGELKENGKNRHYC